MFSNTGPQIRIGQNRAILLFSEALFSIYNSLPLSLQRMANHMKGLHWLQFCFSYHIFLFLLNCSTVLSHCSKIQLHMVFFHSCFFVPIFTVTDMFHCFNCFTGTCFNVFISWKICLFLIAKNFLWSSIHSISSFGKRYGAIFSSLYCISWPLLLCFSKRYSKAYL